MTNTHHAFGIDLSKWNTSQDGKQKVDFDIIANHDPLVDFIGMRAGISWGYQDPWFSYYFEETQRIGRVSLPYHVLYPGENATRQMDNFFRILGPTDFTLTPLVLDLELDHGQTVSKITQTTTQSIGIIASRTGQIPLIYSRATWVDRFLRVADLPPVFWWLANYLWPRPYPLYTPEHPGPPLIPKGVTAWHIHQTADRAKSIGAKAMHYMDYNRFNGDTVDFYNLIGFNQPKPLPCPIDGQPCPRIQV